MIENITNRLRKPISRFLSPLAGKPYSLLLPCDDSSAWVLSWEAREIAASARSLGIRIAQGRLRHYLRRQCVFYHSQFALLDPCWAEGEHRVAVSYFHGLPGTDPAFDKVYFSLRNGASSISRVHVSHKEMRDVALSAGIEPDKVFLIPIGINPAFFKAQTPESRKIARERYGIPSDAVVVGSFQKDGEGWGNGDRPKLIKGPDVFVRAVEILSNQIPGIHVFLSGPARGYVKAELAKRGIPFTHKIAENYPEVGKLFQAIDIYIVASRQEGGPKSILESMASGVPLVTTRVGQAMDIVQNGENGWMVPVEDADGLAAAAAAVLHDSNLRLRIIRKGIATAAMHTYEAQRPLWREFFAGFVEREA